MILDMSDFVKNLPSAIGAMLASPDHETNQVTSDRMAAASSATNNIQMQAAVKSVDLKIGGANRDEFQANRLDGSLTVNNPFKLFRVKVFSWNTTHGRGHIFPDVDKVRLPRDFTTNPSAPIFGPMSYFGLIKCGWKINVVINCNQGHAGALAIVYVPEHEHGHVEEDPTGFLECYARYPHVVLNCSTSNSVDLEIPHCSDQDFVAPETQAQGWVYTLVLSPLKANAGTNGTVTVTFHGSPVDPSFTQPIRKGANDANTGATLGTISLAHGGDSVNAMFGNVTPGRNTKITGYPPAENLLEPFQKAFYLTHADIPTGSGPGTTVTQFTVMSSALKPLMILEESFDFYHGSMYFEFRDVCSKLNGGTLTAIFQFNDSTNPTYDNSRNLYQTTWQLGLNTSHIFTIPYVNISYGRREDVIGRLNVFVSQNITHTAASPTTVSLMVNFGLHNDFCAYNPIAVNAMMYGNSDDNNDVVIDITDVEQGEDAAAETGLTTIENSGNDDIAPEIVSHTAAQTVTLNPVSRSQTAVKMLAQKLVYIGQHTIAGGETLSFAVSIPNFGPHALILNYLFFNCDLKVVVYSATPGHCMQVCHDWNRSGTQNIGFNSAKAGVVGRRHVSFISPWVEVRGVRRVPRSDALGYISITNLGVGEVQHHVYIALPNLKLMFMRKLPRNATVRSMCANPQNHQFLKYVDLDADMDDTVRFPEPTLDFPLLKDFLKARDLNERCEDLCPQPQPPPSIYGRPQTLTTCVSAVKEISREERKKLLRELIAMTEGEDEVDGACGGSLEPTKDVVEKRGPVKDLTIDGDVESNPGPVARLVYLNRGAYKHYGVYVNGKVIHTNTLPGETDLRAYIVAEDFSPYWIVEEDFEIDERTVNYICSLENVPFDFSFDNNCETFARGVLDDDKVKQSDVLKACAIIAFVGSICGAMGESFSMSKPTGFSPFSIFSANLFTGFVDKCKSDLGKMLIKTFIRVIAYVGLFINSPTVTTGIMIATLIATDVSKSSFDSTRAAKLYHAMVAGEVHEIVDAIASMSRDFEVEQLLKAKKEAGLVNSGTDEVDFVAACQKAKGFDDLPFDAGKLLRTLQKKSSELEDDSYSDFGPFQGTEEGAVGWDNPFKEENPRKCGLMDGFKDFNIATTTARGVEWWVGLLKRLVNTIRSYFMPSVADKAMKWMEDNADIIERTVLHALKYLTDIKTHGVYEEEKVEYSRICENLLSIYKMSTAAGNQKVASEVKMILMRVSNNKPPKTLEDSIRFEPVGVYLYGEPGCGKSYVGRFISNFIAQNAGIPHTCYPHPTGSKHMDGYNNQRFHVFDDFGQDAAEEDYMAIIKCCSSVPFVVPQAHLDSKGTAYNSHIVIASSNICDFSGTTTIKCPKALERRFRHRLRIVPKPEYSTKGQTMISEVNGAAPKLDFAKAAEAGVVNTGDAWDVYYQTADQKMEKLAGGGDLKKLSKIAQIVCNDYINSMTAYNRTIETPKAKECELEMLIPLGNLPNVAMTSFGVSRFAAYLDALVGDDINIVRTRKYEGFENIMLAIRDVKDLKEWAQEYPKFCDRVFCVVSFDAGCKVELVDLCIKELFPNVTMNHHFDVKDETAVCALMGCYLKKHFIPGYQMGDVKTLKNSQRIAELIHAGTSPILPKYKEAAGVFKTSVERVMSDINRFESDRKAGAEADTSTGLAPTEFEIIEIIDTPMYNPPKIIGKKYNPENDPAWKRWLMKIGGILFSKPFLAVAGGILGIVSTAVGIWQIVECVKTRDKKEDAVPCTRAYNPILNGKKQQDQIVKRGPGPVHLYKYLIQIKDQNGAWIHGLALGGHAVLVYYHGVENLVRKDNVLRYNGVSYPCSIKSVTPYQDESGNSLDLALVVLNDLPIFLASCRKFVKAPSDRANGICMWRIDKDECIFQDIGPVEHFGPVKYSDGGECAATLKAEFSSVKGSCGGVWTQNQGGNHVIVGLHVAGYKLRATSIAAVIHEAVSSTFDDPQSCGIVTDKTPAMRMYAPGATALRPSPLYEIEEVVQQPAVLHPKDPRLEVPVENMVKHASEKWNTDVYDVEPDLMDKVVYDYASHLKKFTTGSCKEIGLITALNGQNFTNPIDLKTSAGLFYKGLKKTDLIMSVNGTLFPTKRLEDDVMALRNDIVDGTAEVIFGTYLKDELRKNDKIPTGKSRVIEACDLRYTCLYRMVMGDIYEKLYSQVPSRTGCAVGINPYQDFHQMFVDLSRTMEERDYVLAAADYTAYDSTLPEGVLRAGVEVLAYLHNDPDLVRKLHEPVILSKHLVFDEIWSIKGGMPSGAPCTSVLNSIVNVLMCQYVHKKDTGKYGLFITYGDDNICAVDPGFARTMHARMKSCFGVKVTSADKKSEDVTTNWTEVTFLKRSFRKTRTGRVTGVLDRDTIVQHLMWCKGDDNFQDQITSLSMELAAHGREEYDSFATRASEMLKETKFIFPPYNVAHHNWCLVCE